MLFEQGLNKCLIDKGRHISTLDGQGQHGPIRLAKLFINSIQFKHFNHYIYQNSKLSSFFLSFFV